MPILAYDPLPEGSDLSCEITAEGVRIAAAIQEPSARSIRFARRSAAFRAIPDSLFGVTGTTFVVMFLYESVNRGRGFSLPAVIFPIIAVFIAAVYLLAWKGRSDAAIDLLHQARRERTVLFADSNELRIEIDGPRGSIHKQFDASSLTAISRAPITFSHWWNARLPTLRIILKDAAPIDVLPGRDEAELQAVAAILRHALAVPEKVLPN